MLLLNRGTVGLLGTGHRSGQLRPHHRVHVPPFLPREGGHDPNIRARGNGTACGRAAQRKGTGGGDREAEKGEE